MERFVPGKKMTKETRQTIPGVYVAVLKCGYAGPSTRQRNVAESVPGEDPTLKRLKFSIGEKVQQF
jgi:hypothetical protein